MIMVEEKGKTEYEKKLEELKPYELQSIIENFDVEKYESKRDNYSNVFYLMNLRENTHSEILMWLFDFTRNGHFNICQEFTKEFLKSIGIKDAYSDINVKSQENNENGRPDIIIEVGKYVVILEVKLDAKTSIVPDKDGKRRTQYERYKNFAESEYPNKEKKYILIYTGDKRLKKEKDFFIDNNHIDEMNGNKIIELLGYESIEFSDIVLLLYSILKNKINAEQTIEKQNKLTLELIKFFSSLLKDNSDNKKNNIAKIKAISENIDNNKSVKINEKQLKIWKYKRPKQCNISIIESLNLLNIDTIENLLIQYVEYWLFCNTIIDAYTDIVECNKSLFNIYSICEKLDNTLNNKALKDKLIHINKINNKNTYKARY